MKLWGGRFTKETNQLVHNFNASIGFDQKFYHQDIRGSIAYARELSELSGLPVKMTSARADLCTQLQPWEGELFPLTLQELYYQLQS